MDPVPDFPDQIRILWPIRIRTQEKKVRSGFEQNNPDAKHCLQHRAGHPRAARGSHVSPLCPTGRGTRQGSSRGEFRSLRHTYRRHFRIANQSLKRETKNYIKFE